MKNVCPLPFIVAPSVYLEKQLKCIIPQVKRRRYTVFMRDLESALLYSLGHEVAQRNAITGEALNALQVNIYRIGHIFFLVQRIHKLRKQFFRKPTG